MPYYKPKAGEWVQPIRRGYKLGCCDCSLVRRLDFRVHRGHVQFRLFRDERATGQQRRRKREAKAKAAR